MRKLRSVISLIFIVAVAVFGTYTVRGKLEASSEAPIITCDEEMVQVSVNDEEEVLLQGLKAEDKEDGDLTDSIRISSMSHFITDNKRTVTYVVFDSDNQSATYERTIQYTDYTSPRIYVTEPLRYTLVEAEKEQFAETLSATDCLDGDLTKQIRTVLGDSYYTGTTGNHPITLQVNNSAGDVLSIEAEITILEANSSEESSKYYPALTTYIGYATVGNYLDLTSYIKGLEQNGVEYLYEYDAELAARTRDRIQIVSYIDYSQPGVYSVDYIYTSDSGISAVTKLYVVVEGEVNG